MKTQAEGNKSFLTSGGWEYQIDFSASSEISACQQVDSLIPSLRGFGVTSQLQPLGGTNYRMVMTGEQGIEQVRSVLFSALFAAFIGDTAENEINFPISNLLDIPIQLQSNLTTGYSWEVVPSGSINFSQIRKSTFAIPSKGYGASTIQTLVMRPKSTGEGRIELVYQRSFGPEKAATRHLRINLVAQATEIVLSDPSPTTIKDTEASPKVSTNTTNPISNIKINGVIPSSLDWRTSGILPDIRDQGACGSCWAFGTVGAMESAIAKAGGALIDLSGQFLVSCNLEGWNCETGGLTAHKYHYDTLG